MSFNDIDTNLQNEIIFQLYERQKINMNREVGCAYLQPEQEDRVNPSITISRDEIKQLTKRDKIRDVVMQKYEKNLMRSGVEVERIDHDNIRVSLMPTRSDANKFSSFSALEEKNAEDLRANPGLGDSPY